MAITIKEYLERGPATSKEIQSATGMSQSKVARQLRGMGEEVIRLQDGRSLKYAMSRSAFGGSNKLPLSIVDAHGNTVLTAHIRPLLHGGFFVEPATGMPSLLLGENGDGLYDDLPYFLLDLSPQGFLGRQIAEEMADQSLDFPPDPRQWNTDHIGRYLVSNGDDLSGNFKFGEQALLRVRRKALPTPDEEYPKLADSVMNGEIPGSSAGGEQPKFTAYSAHSHSHVIVKFSPPGKDKIAQRWRDILLTEYHAIEAMHAEDIPAAETRLIERGDRLFLESQRFDRSGEHGRLSMVSLQSIDAEFSGVGSGWSQVVRRLYQNNLVSRQHVFDTVVLWCIGRLINNTDMHLGNLSFAIEGNVFRLLPVYDMCSMGFSPKRNGELPDYSFIASEPKGVDTAELNYAKLIARDFWERVINDKRVSVEFKAYLERGNPIDSM
ncbi:MAG: type II toxin-antitoxin system HipA family toxin YjjJ [Candidatus Marinimicrobia bacterium]|nr:type II toxin-antitoxin system HipA family toxin YjjJ [Candidatus Neomarinimicrobiota bacterium]